MGPRVGCHGYTSTFFRCPPRTYYNRYCVLPRYSSVNIGFGFYSGCYSYPRYTSVYYPSYYPVYYPAYYPSSYPVYSDPVYYSGATYEQNVIVADSGDAAYVPSPSVTYYSSADARGEAYFAGPAEDDVAYEYPAPEVRYETVPRKEMAAPSGPRIMDVPSDIQWTEPTAPAVPSGPAAPRVPSAPAGPSEPAPVPAPRPSEIAPPAELPAEEPAEPQPDFGGKSAEELHQLMLDGTQAFAEGRYVDAAERFSLVSRADPENVDAVLATAVARFATGEYTAAAASIRHGIELFPDIVNSTFDLRERYQRTAHFIEHLRALETLVTRRPQDADARIVLGFIRHFSEQRDLARQTFEQLKKDVPSEAELADIFLKALPLEELKQMEAEDAAITVPESPDAAKAQPAIVAPTTRPADAGPPTTAPAGASPVVITPSVPTTQPAGGVTGAGETPVFRGRVAFNSELHPREVATVDGIVVQLKGTDTDPLEAQFDITIGETRMRVRHFRPGATLQIKGASGRIYTMSLLDVDNRTETVEFVLMR